MITNKLVLMLLGLAVVVISYLTTVDWSTLWPSEAGVVLMALGVIKTVLAYLMPPTSQKTIEPTGKWFFPFT
jgi:hypothetical protein